MFRRLATTLVRLVWFSLVLTGTTTAHPRPPAGGLPADFMLPNLQMAPLEEWVIDDVDGRRVLRFTTIFVNVGEGRFELRGFRADPDADEIRMNQILYRSGGGVVRLPGVTTSRYAGDGHDHWHAQAVTVYEMWSDDHPAEVRRGAKINFCFFDNTIVRRDLAGDRIHFYRMAWCGTPETRRLRVGLSRGWGDRYGFDFAYQWIDIEGLPAGTYTVRATVDLQDRFVESNDLDNCAWARIRIPGPGQDRPVELLESGEDCGVAAAVPVSSFPGSTRLDPAGHLRLGPGAHTGYLLNGVGTVLTERSYTLPGEIEVPVDRVANPIGQPGDWYYVTGGFFRGTWMTLGPGVSLSP